MFAVFLWAGFVIGLACAWSRRWYIILAGGVLSIVSFVAPIGYLGGVAMAILLAGPRRRTAA
jgi:hypothetical protein